MCRLLFCFLLGPFAPAILTTKRLLEQRTHKLFALNSFLIRLITTTPPQAKKKGERAPPVQLPKLTMKTAPATLIRANFS